MTRRCLVHGLLVAALCGAWITACQKAEPPVREAAARSGTVTLTAEGIKNAQIEVVTLQPTSFSPRLRVSATIGGDPRKIAQVGARLPGRVTAIRVQLGDHVRSGQALIEIDGVEVHQVTLDYLTATARLRAADDALERQHQLVNERVGAVADLRRAESEQAAAKAALGEATEHLGFLGISSKDVETLGRDVGGAGRRGVVRAPIDGRIAALDVTLGKVLTGAETVVTITQLDRVAAVLRIYERDVSQLRPGAEVEVQVPAYPGRQFAGKVGFIGDLLDPATRTLAARVDLDNADGALKPGMTAFASVPIASKERGLWLPADAVQPFERGHAVFVALGQGRFQPRQVSVGDESGGYVPVVAGIDPGTPVVSRGALTLRGEFERAALEEN